jgi:hypothetical protein
MPKDLTAPNVGNGQTALSRYGLTADRLFIPKTINANGKSFIIVAANLYGGLGAMIVRHQNLAIAPFKIMMMIN